MKTNAVRLLDAMGISYRLIEYEVDPEDLSAETVAAKIGFPIEQVFKTLVARGDRNGVCVAVVPGGMQLDLKALATASNDKKCDVVPLKDVQPLTGYIRGGVTALACKKEYPVYIDETIELFDEVSVSAGVRGTQIIIAPSDYIAAVKGKLTAIAKCVADSSATVAASVEQFATLLLLINRTKRGELYAGPIYRGRSSFEETRNIARRTLSARCACG